MDALRGLMLVLRTPRLWPLCLMPLLGTIVAYAGLGVLGGFLLIPRLEEWLTNGPWRWLAEAGAVIAWILLFPFLFVLLGGIFFGFVFEPLARQVEQLEAANGGPSVPSGTPLTLGRNLADGWTRLLLNAVLGIVAFLLGFMLGPIPGILAAAIIGLLDATAPSFLLRGMGVGAQLPRLRQARAHYGAILSFALVAGLLSLVPFLGILFLPGLVAGGTLLVRRIESDRRTI